MKKLNILQTIKIFLIKTFFADNRAQLRIPFYGAWQNFDDKVKLDKSGIPIMDSSSIVKRVMNYIKLALDERSQYLNIEVIFNSNCNIFTTDIQGNRYLIDGSIGEDMAKAICKSIYLIMATNTGRTFKPEQLNYGILHNSYLPKNLSRVEIVNSPICNVNHDPEKPVGYILDFGTF